MFLVYRVSQHFVRASVEVIKSERKGELVRIKVDGVFGYLPDSASRRKKIGSAGTDSSLTANFTAREWDRERRAV